MKFLILLASVSCIFAFTAPFTLQKSRLGSSIYTTSNLFPKVEEQCQRSFTALSASSTQLSASTTAAVPKKESKGLVETLKVGSLFGLWYALNIGYNIYNKRVLNMVPSLVWSVALLQLFMGLFYVIPVWKIGIRKQPELTTAEVKTLIPVAICHLLTHVGAIISLGAGAVSFTHIVKAAEPAVSAGLSAIFLKSFLPWQVSLTLLPVMGGVALASLSELSFSWLSFISAMVSNVASASRGIVGKMSMGAKSQGKNMDASNLYAVMTILSTLMLFPFTVAIDYKNFMPVIRSVQAAGNLNTLIKETLLSCLFYYSYNEVAFLTLDKVAPVTHALGNTIKRVVIILTSVLVFGTKMTGNGIVGSSIAIFGVLLYSLAKNTFK